MRGAADLERLGAYLSRAKETRTIAILLLVVIFFGSLKAVRPHVRRYHLFSAPQGYLTASSENFRPFMFVFQPQQMYNQILFCWIRHINVS